MPEISGGVLAIPIVKAVLDALGVSYVVEQGSDENGNWYRRFSNGWVEQGGVSIEVPSDGVNIALPIEFKAAGYWASGTANSTSQKNELGLVCNTSSTTQLTIYLRSYKGGVPNLPVSWEVKGFAA